MKTLQGRSGGAVLLARTGVSQPEIASRVGVSRSLVGHWITGARTPSPENRFVLRDAFTIPLDAWDRPASPPPKPPRARGGKSKAEPAVVAELSVRARAERLGQMVQKLLDDVKTCSTPQERARVMASAAQTLNLLGKITGETQEISEERLVKTPAWRRVQGVLVDALRPWPEALLRAGEALQRFGGEV